MCEKIFYLFTLLSLVISPCVVQGKETIPLALAEALTLAQAHNPDLQAARQELGIAQGRLMKAQYPSQFNPELSGTGAHRDFPGNPGSSTDFDLTLSQEFEIAGQRGKRIEEAEQNLAKVTQQVKDTTRLLLAQVKETFYLALSHNRRLELRRTVETLNRRLLSIATARFQAGDLPQMEVNLVRIRLGQARRDTLVAEREYQNLLRDLERLLGRQPEGHVQLAGQLTVRPQTFQRTRLLQLSTRPEILVYSRRS